MHAARVSRWGPSIVAVSGSFSNLSSPLAADIAVGAHLHNGAAGTNGPVYQPLRSKSTKDGKDGIFKLMQNIYTIASATDLTSLLTGGTYVNVHSTSLWGGELRGQVTLVV